MLDACNRKEKAYTSAYKTGLGGAAGAGGKV